ncbi:MAG TPA: hypothetical protein DCS91_18215 [Microcoleaceae bacterium UBA11344]|nr:hypothetical protein [Microcoleaceae cyanobacterium UBA11344]
MEKTRIMLDTQLFQEVGYSSFQFYEIRQTAVGTLQEPISVNLTSNPVTDCCLTIKARSPQPPLRRGGQEVTQSPPS